MSAEPISINPHRATDYTNVVTPPQVVAIRQAGHAARVNFIELSLKLFGVEYDALNRRSGSLFISSLNILARLSSEPEEWFTANAFVSRYCTLAQAVAALRKLEEKGEVRARGTGAGREYAIAVSNLSQE